jgi:hypothetical protein
VRALIAAAVLFAVLLGREASAFANGRYPSSNQLVIRPGDPSTLVMRTTFGMLVTHDRKSFDWVCETGAGYGVDGAVEDPAIAISTGGTLLSGQQRGLAVSKDTGCGWTFAGGGLVGQTIADVSVVRATPGGLVAISSTPADGGYATQIWLSTDDGANFAPYGVPLDPTVLALTLDVAPSDSHRVYVTGERSFLGSGSLFVSTNDGMTWTERPIPLVPSEAGAYIVAIDPKNPDRVYLRTYDATASRLLVTDDAGKNFTTRYSAGFDKTSPTPGLQVALSPDGSKIWVGGEFAHLQVASTTDFAFSQISYSQPQCLVAEGTHLYMCLRDASNTFLVVSENGGQTFDTVLRRCDVRGPIQCGADAEANVCAGEWSPIAAQLAVPCPPPKPDGGIADGGVSPDGGTGPIGSTCGCSGGPAGLSGVATVIAALLLGRRHRSRRRSTLR